MVFITTSAINEATGAGMYARQILAFCATLGFVKVICKRDQDSEQGMPNHASSMLEVRKSSFIDVFARLLGSPSFLIVHAWAIIREIRRARVAVFENSRNGLLILLTRIFAPRTKIFVVFANIERDVARSYLSGSLARRIIGAVDLVELGVIEPIAYKFSDAAVFITKTDQTRFEKGLKSTKDSFILPFALEDVDREVTPLPRSGEKRKVLFTASFTYPPNQVAIREFNEIAARNSDRFEFVAAGRGASQFSASCPHVMIVSDPSDAEMQTLFASCDVYLCTVRIGGGMKTKIAEALRAGLPVIATPQSLIGYEATFEAQSLLQYDDAAQVDLALAQMAALLNERGHALVDEVRSLFSLHYSMPGAINQLRVAFAKAGLIA